MIPRLPISRLRPSQEPLAGVGVGVQAEGLGRLRLCVLQEGREVGEVNTGRWDRSPGCSPRSQSDSSGAGCIPGSRTPFRWCRWAFGMASGDSLLEPWVSGSNRRLSLGRFLPGNLTLLRCVPSRAWLMFRWASSGGHRPVLRTSPRRSGPAGG